MQFAPEWMSLRASSIDYVGIYLEKKTQPALIVMSVHGNVM
jgi:hypothetical protein